MPSRTPEPTPAHPAIPLFDLSPIDRTCIKRLIGHTLASIEREFILETLRYVQGNRTRSADLLRISVRSLRDKIRRYRNEGEDVPDSHQLL
jgi:DNA-binding NtrC family response regulator